MARKQSDYLTALLAEEDEATPATSPIPSHSDISRMDRARAKTLLGRESALARVATGEVRQVTQLLLDPARVRPWKGNARSYAHLTEQSCQELIDSLVAEGGQKVPAIVRRIEGDPDYDYEVIAGTRRHWAISWLRAHSYPDMHFVAQIAQLDDEAAFRFADIENRARKDVSDLERARNYAEAIKSHYDNHLTRMSERLKLSKGWLSKMLKVATIPDGVIDAFASPADVQLKPAYALAQALDDSAKSVAIRKEAVRLAKEQTIRRENGRPTIVAADVLKILLAAAEPKATQQRALTAFHVATGRPMITVQSRNRQGITLRLHSASGATNDCIVSAIKDLLDELQAEGKGLQT